MDVLAVECKEVTKCYGSLRALDSISFGIEEDKITGLIGRNGAGKTTLLKTVSGYLNATKGEVKVLGQNPFNNLEVSKNLIFIDDNLAFHSSMTLEEILGVAEDFYPNWNKKLAAGLTDYFELPLKVRHLQLSKGMKSTFNSILGIAARCRISIFDEPTTGMDSSVRKDFYRALLKDYIDFPRTIILSSHLLGEIEELLEDILLVKNGKVCIHTPLIDLKEFAVGFKGNRDAVLKLTAGREHIYKEEFAPGYTYMVFKKQFSEKELEAARLEGIEVKAVSADDLCIYLTAGDKGGIDDVFKR